MNATPNPKNEGNINERERERDLGEKRRGEMNKREIDIDEPYPRSTELREAKMAQAMT